ncbi:MAG: cytochrome c biogenesis heme-transporting ATPase CcmA [Pseudomonadales bacterium]|nr:cytochrome c biogenesis heme-transporting ATPase CcmA [Pseudomonadales bacterium]
MMLQTSQLSCERRDRILFEGLSFSVEPGEVLRVLGPNGAGKTTLLRILAGLYQEFEGEVSWDLQEYPLYLGHRPGVKDLLSPLENLRYFAALFEPVAGDDVLVDALAQVGLAGLEDAATGTLSEGQRKRVSLARLVFVQSPAWILDEPFSAIDVAGVRLIEGMMAQHIEGGGLVVLTSHQEPRLPRDSRSIDLAAL